MNASLIPLMYNITNKEELKTKMSALKTATFNSIYTDNINSRFTKIYKSSNIIPYNICDIYIADGEKFASKKRGWLFNKVHDYGVKEIPLNVVESLFPFIKNVVYQIIIPFIEEKYELAKWSLDIADGSILKIEETQSQEDFDLHKNPGEFTFVIPLETSKNGIMFENGEMVTFEKGDVIVFSSRTKKKFVGNCENSRFIMGCLKFMNGYKSLYNHNVHPNLLNEEEREKVMVKMNKK